MIVKRIRLSDIKSIYVGYKRKNIEVYNKEVGVINDELFDYVMKTEDEIIARLISLPNV